MFSAAMAASVNQNGTGHRSADEPRPVIALSGSAYRARYASAWAKGTTSTGAPNMPCHRKVARTSGAKVQAQKRSVSSGPWSTRYSMPWENPALGARWAALSRRSRTAASTGSGRKLRTIRRRRMTSDSSTGKGQLLELGQILGHGPAEGDQRVAPLLVDLGEVGRHRRIELLRLEALVVEEAGEAVALGDEGAVVVLAGFDPEPLGEP